MTKTLNFYEEILMELSMPNEFTDWLKGLMLDFYNTNNKTFLILTEKETTIFRKRYCEDKSYNDIGKLYNITGTSVSEIIRRKKRELIKNIYCLYICKTNPKIELEKMLLSIKTKQELYKLGIRRVSDILKLSEQDFIILTNVVSELTAAELKKIIEIYKLELQGKNIPLENDDVLINELNISEPILKSLFWSGIKTKSQLSKISKDDFKKIIGIGKKEYEEIETLLEEENIELPEISSQEIKKEDLDTVYIERLNLTNRTYYALYRNNIRTVGEIFRLPTQQFKSLKGMGPNCFYEIIGKIINLGYDYKEEFKENDTRQERINEIEKKIQKLQEEKEKLLKEIEETDINKKH